MKYFFKMLAVIPFKTHMDEGNARCILMKYWPKPQGSCCSNNVLDIRYDLQIIIPVFNVENTIVECLKSVIAQTTKYSVCVTIVNNCSTDNSAVLVERVVKDYKGNIEFEVTEQKEKGLSEARNTALRTIKGRYVTFLDSDDVLGENAINKMLFAADNYDADIVQGSWYEFNEKNSTEHILKNNVTICGGKASIPGFPWGKCFKAEVLKTFHFPDGYWFEDTPISFILPGLPYKLVTIDYIVYGYRLNPNGITIRSNNSRKVLDSYWITEECLYEFPVFGVLYDQRAYEYLLKQIVINARRIGKMPIRIRKAGFVLGGELLTHFFDGFRTEVSEMTKIESAIKNKQYYRFEMLIRT